MNSLDLLTGRRFSRQRQLTTSRHPDRPLLGLPGVSLHGRPEPHRAPAGWHRRPGRRAAGRPQREDPPSARHTLLSTTVSLLGSLANGRRRTIPLGPPSARRSGTRLAIDCDRPAPQRRRPRNAASPHRHRPTRSPSRCQPLILGTIAGGAALRALDPPPWPSRATTSRIVPSTPSGSCSPPDTGTVTPAPTRSHLSLGAIDGPPRPSSRLTRVHLGGWRASPRRSTT